MYKALIEANVSENTATQAAQEIDEYKRDVIELSPHISPSRSLLSETYLPSIRYGNLSTMLPLHTALDASLLVFFAPVGTCSLNQSYGYAFGRRRPLTQKIRRNHRIAW